MSRIPADKLRIGRSLLAGGPVTQELLQAELDRQGKGASVLGKALLKAGFPREEDLIYPLLAKLRIPRINAKNTKIPLETVALLPEELASQHSLLPLDRMGNLLVVVTSDVGNDAGMAAVRGHTGMTVFPIQSDPKSCTADEFVGIVKDYYRRVREAGIQTASAAGAAQGGAVASGANGVLTAIPVGSPNEDTFFKRFLTAGPVPAVQKDM